MIVTFHLFTNHILSYHGVIELIFIKKTIFFFYSQSDLFQVFTPPSHLLPMMAQLLPIKAGRGHHATLVSIALCNLSLYFGGFLNFYMKSSLLFLLAAQVHDTRKLYIKGCKDY